MRKILRLSPAWIVAGLVIASTVVRFVAGRRVHTPWITPDEVIYGMLGRSLYHSARFAILGKHIGFFGFVFPALIGAPLSISNLERGFHWVKLICALTMSLTAVPVYVWTRSLARTAWALVAAVLTVAIPGLAYSGLLMTEVAFYPALVLAGLALALALESPTPWRQAFLVAAFTVAAMTRLQAFVLLPVFVTAVGLKAVLDRNTRTAARLAPAFGGLLALTGLWTAWRLSGGAPLSSVFGAYAPAGQTHYDVGESLRFALFHAGDLLLFPGVFPACAVALLFAVRRRSPALDAYLVTVVALAFWFALEVGVFASKNVGYLAERNLLPLAPILFVGFAAWLDRGGPRPPLATAVVCVAAIALVVAMPVARLVSPDAFPNSFTMLPLIEYEQHHPGANLDLFLAVFVAVAVVVFATAPRRLLVLLPTMLTVFFVWTSVSASREIVRLAGFLQRVSVGSDRRWIDRNAAGPVSFLYIGEQNWPDAWENLFWSRSLKHVYTVRGTEIPGGMPQEQVEPREDGRVFTLAGVQARGAYAVAQYPIAFVGRSLVTAGDGLVLWRIDPPLRLSAWTQRVAGHVHLIVYACRAARVDLRLKGPQLSRVELARNEHRYRIVHLSKRGEWTGSVPLRAPAGHRMCTVDVVSPPQVIAPGVELVRLPRR
jgi:hypothetical protein